MSDSSVLSPEAPASDSSSPQLPISSIVRAVCEAAKGGPDLLYEVMIKMSLMVEATAPTYGLSIWATSDAGKATLRWAEGLEEEEIAIGEGAVTETFSSKGRPQPATEGDQAICLLLALPSPLRAPANHATSKGTQRAQRRRAPGPFSSVICNRCPEWGETGAGKHIFRKLTAGNA